jgi:hypothetical protein
MKYDLVRTETQEKIAARLMYSFVCLPANSWTIQKLSHANIACILGGWYCGIEPYYLKAIPRINNQQENLIEILKHNELLGSIDVPDDIESVRHVLRMHKLLVEFELEFPNEFRVASDLIYCQGDEDTSELATEFIDESNSHCRTAVDQTRASWDSFLGEFLKFCPAKDIQIAA